MRVCVLCCLLCKFHKHCTKRNHFSLELTDLIIIIFCITSYNVLPALAIEKNLNSSSMDVIRQRLLFLVGFVVVGGGFK